VTKNREYNCKIWEAARATTAAPTFFRRIKIGPKGSAIEYEDAGLGYNNPIKQVIAERARVFGNVSEVDCIVSIGTGEAKSTGYEAPNAFQKWLPTKLVSVLKTMVTDCSKTAEEMAIQYKNIPALRHRTMMNY
jgi:patatin-like phospholipase/acyl hydrolase